MVLMNDVSVLQILQRNVKRTIIAKFNFTGAGIQISECDRAGNRTGNLPSIRHGARHPYRISDTESFYILDLRNIQGYFSRLPNLRKRAIKDIRDIGSSGIAGRRFTLLYNNDLYCFNGIRPTGGSRSRPI